MLSFVNCLAAYAVCSEDIKLGRVSFNLAAKAFEIIL